MKILDEVIKAFEYTYENDPIAWTYGVDALYYLKEYRKLLSAKPPTTQKKSVDQIEENLHGRI